MDLPRIEITVHESFQPQLREEDISALETELGISLPTDYRSFLLAHNGGSPEPSVFPILDDPPGNLGVINRFLGICTGEYEDLRSYAEVYRGRMPPNLLPIADDPGGNLICLSVSGRDRGKVYFWFHEEEADEGEPPTRDNLYFVANSFSELLNSLTEGPD